MREDTVVELRQPGTFSEDPLTAVLRHGARRLLAQAVEMEVTGFVEMHAERRKQLTLMRVEILFQEIEEAVGKIVEARGPSASN